MQWVAGLLLISAAALKALQLLTDAAATVVHPLGQYYLPAEIGVELAGGLLVLSGLYWRILRWFVLLLFMAFAGYSLYLALSGAISCGCFGPLHVNPWWTFGLDCAVVLGLGASAFFQRRSRGNDIESSDVPKFQRRRRAVAAVMGIVVIFTALLFRYAGQRTAIAGGLLTSVGDLVILEPEQWIGQQLPISKSIDLDLSNGEWIVLLHRHDCPDCQKTLPRYEKMAMHLIGQQVAIVEVPPYGNPASETSTCCHGRLADDHEWFVQTPVELRLENGIVKSVKTHGN
jgi:hypothetical protein